MSKMVILSCVCVCVEWIHGGMIKWEDLRISRNNCFTNEAWLRFCSDGPEKLREKKTRLMNDMSPSMFANLSSRSNINDYAAGIGFPTAAAASTSDYYKRYIYNGDDDERQTSSITVASRPLDGSFYFLHHHSKCQISRAKFISAISQSSGVNSANRKRAIPFYNSR